MILGTSCASQKGVQVRFRNDSGEDFTQLQARFRDTTITLDGLRAGETSRSVSVASTFPYFSTTVTTARDTLTYLPIDNVGQEELTGGKLTLYLSIVPAGTGRRLELRPSKP
ncbi:MAG TPA: hypothetical protein VGE66_15135 [Chitinophagaceae bacterium]